MKTSKYQRRKRVVAFFLSIILLLSVAESNIFFVNAANAADSTKEQNYNSNSSTYTQNNTTENAGNSTSTDGTTTAWQEGTTQSAAEKTTDAQTGTTQENTTEIPLLPYKGPAPGVPSLLYKSAVSVWVNATEGMEYGIRTLGSQEDYRWQNGNLFFGLAEHTSYEIVARYKKTAEMKASENSTPLVVMTDYWTYSLRYKLAGGTNGKGNVLSFQNGQQELALASPARAGYLFQGWYLESSCQNQVTSFNCNIARNKLLYAKWKKISKDKITGVKLKKKSGSKLQFLFSARSDVAYYEIQYSTQRDFSDESTVKLKVTSEQFTTDTLTPGEKYYFRVRGITVDSAGRNVYTAYSSVIAKKLKASAIGTAAEVKSGKAKKSATKVYKKKKQYIMVGETVTLDAPAKTKTNKAKLVCKSKKKKIATVSANAVVKAKKTGKTKITLTRGNVCYQYEIVVENVTINRKTIDMVVGEKTTLSLSGGSKKASFKTSNKKKATVNKNGEVTAVGSGTVTITATYRGRTYTSEVSIITQEQKKIDSVSDFYFTTIHRVVPLSAGAVSLEYQVSPANRTPSEIAWYSSNPAVAVVTDGVITPVGTGVTEISVKYSSGSAKMKVEVIAGSNTLESAKLVCHRGGNSAPENTLEAFEKAAKAGYKYVETDIRWTKDNVPVLIHDATVERTTKGVSNVKVNQLTYEECMQLDIGSYFGEEYKDTKIVRFDDFLALCQKYDLKPYVELKGTMYYEQSSLLARLVEHYQLANQVTWISFSEESLQSVAEQIPGARLGYLSNVLTESVVQTASNLQNGQNTVFLDISYANTLTLDVLRLVGNSGMDLECYTIDDINTAKNAIAQGAVGITTNKITKDALIK